MEHSICISLGLLRTKESKVNKLKQVLNDLDDLRYFQPNHHREVELKMSIVNEMIEKSLTEARQLISKSHMGAKNVTPKNK